MLQIQNGGSKVRIAVLIWAGILFVRDNERHDALSKAIDVFWRNGYEDAKMEDVVAATGQNRYALYSTFGGKRELFLEALAVYHHRLRGIFWDGLEDESCPPLGALRRVATHMIREMASRGAGCFLCNVAGQEARKDAVIAQRVQDYLTEIQAGMQIAMERAAARGDLAPWITPAEGAAMFMSMKLGCGAQSAAGASVETLLANLNTGMALLSAGNQDACPLPDGANHQINPHQSFIDQPEYQKSWVNSLDRLR